MQSFIEDIYLKHEYDLDMFGFEVDSCNDTINDFYVYAWYIKSNPKKYFYVGKGKKDRYKHILWDINVLKKNPKNIKESHISYCKITSKLNMNFCIKN